MVSKGDIIQIQYENEALNFHAYVEDVQDENNVTLTALKKGLKADKRRTAKTFNLSNPAVKGVEVIRENVDRAEIA